MFLLILGSRADSSKVPERLRPNLWMDVDCRTPLGRRRELLLSERVRRLYKMNKKTISKTTHFTIAQLPLTDRYLESEHFSGVENRRNTRVWMGPDGNLKEPTRLPSANAFISRQDFDLMPFRCQQIAMRASR
jgi:hypothetical protein